mmetsp:Transcript_20556/g.37357  ORF Transcript_20556/g.37357 Transcript_20556/m.37357 type:complete len:510 (+) Transcript_20556:2-1531(+)
MSNRVLPRTSGPIEEPSIVDVICGRGAHVTEHRGNLQMRGFCVDVRDEYMAAEKPQKSDLINSVVQKVRNTGGRFLKKDSDTGFWWEIGDTEAKRKVSQVLRESTPDKEAWQQSTADIIQSGIVLQQSTCVLAQQAKRSPKRGLNGLVISDSLSGVNLLTDVSNSPPHQLSNDTKTSDGAEAEDLFTFLVPRDLLDAPKFTEEDEMAEIVSTTEEERLQTLSYLFGDLCEISQPKKKVNRVKINAQQDAVSEMRSAINSIPVKRKQAMVQAMRKCSLAEFSEKRMKQFLHREGGNAERAANRFVRYWQKRHQLFGTDKFCLPMTLEGALRDDAVALECGGFKILPKPDASGRPIMLGAPHCHTRVGYDTESMLRAIWYVFELVADEENARKGVVLLADWTSATIWDYDAVMDQFMFEIEREYLPWSFAGIHAIGLPLIIVQILKPAVCAVMGKETRAKLIVHQTEGDLLLKDLEIYGIPKVSIPVEIGGCCHHSHHEWLQMRRRVESNV